MSIYKFTRGDFTGSVRGLNGPVFGETGLDGEDKKMHLATEVQIEVMESTSFDTWSKRFTRDDLDGMFFREVSQIVPALQSVEDEKGLELSMARNSENGLSLIFAFESFFGKQEVELRLDEVDQDRVDILKKRIDFLTKRLEALEGENEDEKVDEKVAMVAMGSGLKASEDGSTICNTVGSWRTATFGCAMSEGVYYAEFQTLRMTTNWHMMSGIVQTTQGNLESHIGGIGQGACVYLNNGQKQGI